MVPPMPRFGAEYRSWSLVLGPRDRGTPTKTGIYDDAVILDHEELAWIGPLLSGLVARHPGLEPLWDFDEHEFRTAFARAAELSGLRHLHLTPYHLRHAGPSWDALRRRRSQREIQRRGRWASALSVQRYERSSRVVAVLQDLPSPVLDYLKACEARLSSIVLGTTPVPARPAS